MKFLRLFVTAAFALAFSNAYAFHSGGVAECEGCHSMHNSTDDASVIPGRTKGNSGAYLLKANDQSSACLNCHNAADSGPSSYHISTDESKLGPGIPPVEMTPGGDFAWLKKSYEYLLRGTPSAEHGQAHGHNVIAADYNYVAETSTSVAPGGTYPVTNLTCSSCHDPHGRYRRVTNNPTTDADWTTTGAPIFGSGSYPSSSGTATLGSGATYPQAGRAAGAYRILAGKNYLPKSITDVNLAFGYNPPNAMSPSSYNRSESVTQTHVAYGSGMSEWCANCHGAFLENAYASGAENHRHPAGNAAKFSTAIATAYNSYVSSGVMTNADPTKAYSTLVPFELGTSNYVTLAPLARNDETKNQQAVAGTSNVMCLSCHRAHASGFEFMTRFYIENEFMTVASSSGAAMYDMSTTEGKINHGKTVAEQTAAYYGRPATAFGPYNRVLCNKCHAKD